MAKPDLPSVDTLRQMFSYCGVTGRITFLKRDTAQAAKMPLSAWNLRYAGKLADGTITMYGYRRIWLNGAARPAHRVAWALYHGEWPSDQIDHINGDKTDNRISNLRCVDQRANSRNKARVRVGKSGHYCIWPRGKRWEVMVARERVGTFLTLEAAITARDARLVALGYTARFGTIPYKIERPIPAS